MQTSSTEIRWALKDRRKDPAGRDPGELYHDLTREFGELTYDRVEAPALPSEG